MKTYVITGTTSGIGKALLEFFGKDNIVFAGYRDDSKKQALIDYSDNVIPFYVDYSKPETIEDAILFIKSKTPKVDTIINVAGAVVAGAIEKLEISELKRQFDVNVFGALRLTQGIVELLDGGKVINISSMSSYGIYPFIAPYCASKRALDILFNCFGLETKKNIKVVSVKPGVIATPIWTKSLKENETTINNCEKDFKNEIDYMSKNARKNSSSGLSVDVVVDKISKIDKMSNPKPSYCIGLDSVATAVVSRLPQALLNKIIRFKLNKIR